MLGRLVVLTPFAALLLTACGNPDPNAGAARVELEWSGFAPGCLTLLAESDGKTAAPTSFTLSDGARAGSRTVAVYRGDGWGNEVTLTARATEGGCADGKVVAESLQHVTITQGVAEVKLSLSAPDLDQDGFVDGRAALPGSDCNDSAPAVHPFADEACNAIDDDCDGAVDDGVGYSFYADADQDGYGDAQSARVSCSKPTGYVENANDCDDADARVLPNGTETCNGRDDDCDGVTDEELLLQTWYRDQDGDGFGGTSSAEACIAPGGFVDNSRDCDDADPAVKPTAAEDCNEIDDDCDGQVDDGVRTTWYMDADGDTEGNKSRTTLACTAPQGYVSNPNDCDDGNPFRLSSGTEVCDELDNDCDAAEDDGLNCTTSGWRIPDPTNIDAANDWKRVTPFAANKAYAVGYDEDTTASKLRAYSGVTLTHTLDGQCAGPLYSGWADPVSHIVYLGQEGAWSWHAAGTASCGGTSTAPVQSRIRGAVGFSDAANGVTLFGATGSGDVVGWPIGQSGAQIVVSSTAGNVYWDIDATDALNVIAVGADRNVRPVIVERNDGLTFTAATLPSSLPSGLVELRAVSISGSGYAMAVGDQGLVLARGPNAVWAVLPGPPNATALTGVKVFGRTLAYVVGATSSGTHEAWRWNGAGWTVLSASLPNAKAPRDVDGLSPDDLWIAGDDGLLRHWQP